LNKAEQASKWQIRLAPKETFEIYDFLGYVLFMKEKKYSCVPAAEGRDEESCRKQLRNRAMIVIRMELAGACGYQDD
jgi:hypothetical protein